MLKDDTTAPLANVGKDSPPHTHREGAFLTATWRSICAPERRYQDARGRRVWRPNPKAVEPELSAAARRLLVVTSPRLFPRTDTELAGLDELVFMLDAVASGMPVVADGFVPAVRYGLVHPRHDRRVLVTPRGVRTLAIARGEVAAGMD